MSNVISFNVYKNTLRRSSGNDPVSSESGYTEILCQFKEGDDWDGVNGGIVTAGFFVSEDNVEQMTANVVNREARFTIPGTLVGNRNPIYFGLAGSISTGENSYITIATNVVKLDVIRGVVIDRLSPDAEADENHYAQLLATLNEGLTSKADKAEIDNRFELHLSVAFDENGVPVKWDNKTTYSAGDFTGSRIVKAFIASNVTQLNGGTFAQTNLTDIYIDKVEGTISISPTAYPAGTTVHYKGEFNAVGFIVRAMKYFEENKADKANVYTKSEVNTALGTKANAETVQTLISNVTSILAKNEEQDAAIAGKAAANHTHSEYVTNSEMQEALANIDVEFDASKAVRAFNGENDEIIKYLSKEPQTDAAYANSNVNTQITERWDIPGSLAIDVPTNTACFRIVDCKSGNEWKEQASGASFVLRNLIPGRSYRYYALKADDSVLGSGCCTARGQVRMIDVPKSDGTRNVFNIRDIGGWACDGGRIKYGLIFRGARLNGANSNVTDSTITLDNSQIAYFKNILNIKYEIDLRSTSEAAEQEGSVLGNDVGYMRQYIKYYQQSIQDNGAQYKALIEQVADNLNAGKVTYIHCASGADRTAQLCFFIEAICGVSLVNIENDYELTYYAFEYKSGIIDRRRNKITNACWKLFIDELNSETGSTIQEKAVNYLLGKGVTTATIGIIREKLIEHCVPTRTSQLENDSGFLTAQDISEKINYVEVQKDDVNQNEADSCINENTIYHVYVRSSVVAHGWTNLLCVKHQSYVVQYALTSSRYIIIRRGSISNGVITWDETWRNVENASNKVTSISSASTDAQYPTAKAVYDKIRSEIQTAIGGIENGSY